MTDSFVSFLSVSVCVICVWYPHPNCTRWRSRWTETDMIRGNTPGESLSAHLNFTYTHTHTYQQTYTYSKLIVTWTQIQIHINWIFPSDGMVLAHKFV